MLWLWLLMRLDIWVAGYAKPSTTLNFYGHLIEDAKFVALEMPENNIRPNKKPNKKASKSKSVI